MLQTALLPISLKEPRQKLADMAECMKHFGTDTVYLLHVVSQNPSHPGKRLEESIRGLANMLRDAGFYTEIYFKQGRIADAVCQATLEFEVDYLALQWRKKNVIKQTLLGSPDADILRMCSLPVFVYQSGGYMERKNSLNRVLYATDFQHTDRAVMPYLTNTKFQADTLYLLHVGERAPDPPTEEKRRKEAKSNLDRLAQECSHAYNTVETIEVTGSIRSQIVRQAQKRKVDLIIIGKADKPVALGQMMGSIAETLPNRTNCSVFMVTEIPRI